MTVKSGHIMCEIPIRVEAVHDYPDGKFVTFDVMDGRSHITLRVGETFVLDYKLDLND